MIQDTRKPAEECGIHGKTYLGARALCLWEAAMKLPAVTQGTVIARSVPGNNQTPVS